MSTTDIKQIAEHACLTIKKTENKAVRCINSLLRISADVDYLKLRLNELGLINTHMDATALNPCFVIEIKSDKALSLVKQIVDELIEKFGWFSKSKVVNPFHYELIKQAEDERGNSLNDYLTIKVKHSSQLPRFDKAVIIESQNQIMTLNKQYSSRMFKFSKQVLGH